jgi:hypothetical protein
MSSSAIRSLAVATKGKGAVNVARRARSIGSRYGLGPRRMERCLRTVLELVQMHGCRATLPITALAVERHPRAIAELAEHGIEFALHGLRHVDHRELGAVEQVEQFGRARRIFERNGIPVVGFRAPYLRSNAATLHALRENGFDYDSTQAFHWPIPADIETDGYRRAIGFYDARPMTDHPSLPWIEDGIVRIPCSIPDDEAAVDRLRLSSPRPIADLWLDGFRATHDRGELLTLAVHPERIALCGPAIAEVLAEARSSSARVWIARLDEIARWWRARAGATVELGADGDGRWHVDITGPEGLIVSTSNGELPGPRSEGAWIVLPGRHRIEIRASKRPLVGIHPSSTDRLSRFLRAEGFFVEIADRRDGYAAFLRRDRLAPQDEDEVLRELAQAPGPLLRLGRWPEGAKSAVAITGDVDALTIWDYASRFVGR